MGCRRCNLYVTLRIYPVRSNRLGNILDRLLAEKVIGQRQFTAYGITGGAGDADATWLGESFQPRGDIHAVAIHFAAINNDFTEINADAKLDALICLYGCVFLLDRLLDGDGAIEGVGHGGEIGQHGIPGVVLDVTAMGFDGIREEIEIAAEGAGCLLRRRR